MDLVLQASTEVKPVSCNAENNADKSTNGEVHAQITGGVQPHMYLQNNFTILINLLKLLLFWYNFSIEWDLGPYGTSNATNVTELSAIDGAINVFINSIDSRFTDSSSGQHSTTDTCMFYSLLLLNYYLINFNPEIRCPFPTLFFELWAFPKN